jgi:hypothetical protein
MVCISKTRGINKGRLSGNLEQLNEFKISKEEKVPAIYRKKVVLNLCIAISNR